MPRIATWKTFPCLAALLLWGSAAWADYEAGQAAWQARQYAEALTQWEAAARTGDDRAMLALGRVFVKGLGVPQDYVLAHTWLNLAAGRGNEAAAAEREALAVKMTPQQIALAQEQARTWRSSVKTEAPKAAVPKTVASSPPTKRAIREAQKLMADLGYKPGPADGVWGPRSAKAYAAFLRDAGMPPGEMLTLDALRAMRNRAGKEKAPGAVAKAGNETPSTEAESEATAAGPARPAPKCAAWNTKKFFEAATPEIVTRCLRGGADVKARDKHGRTALHWAAPASGNPAVIAALLKGGADLSARDKSGRTPLHLSVWNREVAVMKALLEAGADPNAGEVEPGKGYTPLHYAVWRGKPVFIATLLDAGADPNARDRLGKTPVDVARKQKNAAVLAALKQPPAASKIPSTKAESEARAAGSARPASKCAAWNTKKFFEAATPEIVTRCLRGGSDPKAWDNYGRTPLHWAGAWSGSSTVIDVLVKAGADPNAREEKGKETPLHWAARVKGNSAVIAALLKGGANLHARRREAGATPLLLSVWNEDIAVMKALLEAGADPNVGTVGRGESGGDTPLHVAVSLDKPVFITTLLEAGADPNAWNASGNTPVDLAHDNKNPAVLATLKKAAAELRLKGGESEKAKGTARTDPNARDKDGRTRLHRAAEYRTPAAIRTLLRAGADPNARDKNGETPLHRAAYKSKRPPVIAALAKGGADLNARDNDGRTPLHVAASWFGTPEIVGALLSVGADPNARDKGRGTPLYVAAFNKNPAVTVSLLKAGADPNAQNEHGNTPLHIAGYSNNPAVTAALLKGGADPNVRNGFDDTPLHEAAATSGNPAIIAALIEAGADPNAGDGSRSTPLHRAVAGKNPAAITALLKAGADPSIPDFFGNTPMDDARKKNDPAVIAALPQGQRPQAGSARPARPASGSPSGECGSGPICQQTVKNAELVLRRASELQATGNLDITNSNLALAFTTRTSIACIKACLEREETRAECTSGLQGAIGELKRTYDSAIRSAREASLDDDYVDEFEASPQNSSFGRKYFSHIQGNLDTCGY